MSLITPEKSTGAIPEPPQSALDKAQDAPSPGIGTPLKVAIGSSFVLRLAGASTGLLLAAYLRQIVHADANVIGVLAAVFYATELLLAPVFGAFSDLRGRKPFLVFGPIAGAIAVQIHPLTTIIGILALGRLIEGLATAANAPGTLGFLADATSGTGPKSASLRGRVMGMYEISFVVGLVGGNLLGGQLWEMFRANGFRLVSLVYIAAAAILFFFIPETLPASAREHHNMDREAAQEAAHPIRSLLVSRLHSYAELLRAPALRSFVPAWLAINAVLGLWLTHIAPLLLETRGTASPFPGQLLAGRFTATEVGFALGGFGVVFMVGIYLWSLFYGRLRKTNMMLASIGGLFIVCFVLAGINNNILPGPWGQWPLLPVLAIGVLLESGFTPVALAYLADISETKVEHRGAVMGLYSVFLGIGQFIGGSTGGLFIVGMGFNGLLIASLLLGAVAGSAVYWLRTKHGV